MGQCKSWSKVGIAMLVVLSAGKCQSKMLVHEMQCEYSVQPQGVDVAAPVLSWKLESNVRGDRQSAYRVAAAENIDRLKKRSGVLWDSGKLHSSNSLNIRYSGRTLNSNKTIFWSVQVWDKNGKSTGKPRISSFTTGLMKPSDWHGTWIRHPREPVRSEADYYAERPAPLLRKEFVVKKTVKRAAAFATGLGCYELHLNGKKVGDQQFGTAWTTFSKRVLTSTFDVTSMLKKGVNTVGFVLGNGWYDPLPLRMWGHLNVRESLAVGEPRALLELRIEYTDGTTQNVVTDPSWRAGESPILRNSIYLGELYDGRNELPGWDKASFQDSSWKQAAIASDPIGKLCSQTLPPVRVTHVLLPKRITEIKPGVFIYDMGQNFAGTVTLRVSGPAGTRVVLRYGELLYPDGTLNVKTSCAGQIKNAHGGGGPGAPDTAEQTDTYILRGSGLEVYTPRFTWHGFRYVEVTGYPGKPAPDSIIGNRMNTDVSQQGMEFTCSSDLLNRIHQMTQWTLLSNLFSVQSDCPHRERFGYGGDIAATSEMAMLHFDMSRFYSKAVIDLEDAVRPNGGFTETAPYVGIADSGLGGGSGPMGWGIAHNLLLWQLYQYYGNAELIRTGYPFAKRYVALLERTAKDDILDQDISDHESLVTKPVELTATAYYYLNVRLAEKMANLLHKSEDAAGYHRLAGRIYGSFQQRFRVAGTGKYDSGSQACQAFVLALGLAPEDTRKAAIEVLVEDIHQHGDHLTTGIFGTKYMLNVLSENGYADLAYKIVSQRSFPGWGYMLDKGATTLWEHWEGSDDTFSQNHPMFGSVDEWMTKTVGGISPAPDAIGFDHVLIRPQVVGDLKSASAHYESVHGNIVSEWNVNGAHLEMHVSIPVGCSADVTIPTGWKGQRSNFQVASGSYVFEANKR